jgi:TonB family protein
MHLVIYLIRNKILIIYSLIREVMKTQNQFKKSSVQTLILVLPALAIMMFAVYSCGRSTNQESAITGIATPPPAEPVFAEVDTLPVFPGGDREILNFIINNTKYPAEAKKNNITGKVIVKFIIETDGSVSGAEVLKGVDPLLDAEAVRVVGTLPRFEKPAKKDGKIVRVSYMLPITFALQ